jgi:hypothetical protein
MTLPNSRNGNHHHTTLWSDDTHEYAVVINLDWSIHAYARELGRRSDDGTWDEHIDLGDVPDDPFGTSDTDRDPEADDHYRLSIWRHRNRTYVAGWMHQDPQSIARTDPGGGLDTLTSCGDLFLAPGNDMYSYNLPVPLPDGSVRYWTRQSQQTDPDEPRVLGAEFMSWLLPADSDTPVWQGSTVTCNEDPDDDDPQRAYVYAASIDPWTDDLYVIGAWMMIALNQDSRRDPYMLRFPAAEGYANAYTLDGVPVDLPLDHATALATGKATIATIWNMDTPGAEFPSLGCTQVAFRGPGKPLVHIYSDTAAQARLCEWTGDDWLLTSPNANFRPVNVGKYRRFVWRMVGASPQTQMRLTPATGGSNVFFTPAGTVSQQYQPTPDPIRLRRGVLAVMVPDGDTPHVYQFGGGPTSLA